MRKPLLINLLLIACCAYLGIHLKRFWQRPYQASEATPADTAKASETAPSEAAPSKKSPPLATYNIIGEGNIFRPERKEWTPPPPPPPKPVKQPPAPPPPPPPAPLPEPALLGIIIDENQKTAIMQGHSREKLSSPQRARNVHSRYRVPTRYRIVEEPMGTYHIGDTISEAKIIKIDSDRVVLERDGKVFQVLLRDPKNKKPAQRQHSAPPQRARPKPHRRPYRSRPRR